MMIHLSRQMLLSGAALAAFATQAMAAPLATAPSSLFNQNAFLPLMPRITGMGLFGDYQVVAGDAIAALWGNQDHIFYMDIQSKTAFEPDWSGSLGAGFRVVNNDQRILGAYVFADRNVSSNNNEFWFLSPGIESLGQVFDFRVNGYFPTNTKRQYGSTNWADSFGVYDYVTFTGHTQYDILMTQDEEVGWGGDAEVGVAIPGTPNIRVYAGGYHFNSDDASDINGVAARVEVPVNRYLSLTVRDSYDNVQNNTFMAGVKLTFGGVNEHPRDQHQAIQERMLDPIERNMATLGQGTAEPIQTILTPVSSPKVQADDVWFFLPGSTSVSGVTIDQCTFENPCVGLNQNTIDSIASLDPNASLYFAPGQYFPIDSPTPEAGILTVAGGQSFWGRTSGYKAPATGSNRAVMNGVLQLSGNNTLDSLQIFNDSVDEDLPEFGVSKTGIHVLASGKPISLNNVNTEVTNNDLNNGAFSLFAEGSGEIIIKNSTFNAVENAMTSINGAENLVIIGNNSFIIRNSDFNATSQNAGAYNIYNQTLATTLTISDSTMNATALGDTAAANIFLIGANSSLNLDQSTLTATASGSNSADELGATNISIGFEVGVGEGISAVINRSTLNATNDNPTGEAINIVNVLGTLTLNNSTLTATDSGGMAADGVFTRGGSTAINDSVINTIELGGNPSSLLAARGVYNQGGDVSIDNTQINVTANTDTSTTAGVYVEGATGKVTNSVIQVTEQGAGYDVSGLIASLNSTLSVSQTQVYVNATTSGTIYGALAIAGSAINIDGSEFQVTSGSGSATGAYTFGPDSSISINNSDFDISSLTGQAAGVRNNGDMTIVDSNFIINGNGSSQFNTGVSPVVPTGGTCVLNGGAC